MTKGLDGLRIAKMLVGICLAHTLALLALGIVIHAEPSRNALLVPRAEGLFVVGENRFGLIRIKPFQKMSEVETFLKTQGLKIPELTEAHLKPHGRMGKLLHSNRLSLSAFGSQANQKMPIIEAHNSETAHRVQKWIENGDLRTSRLGYAIRLEE